MTGAPAQPRLGVVGAGRSRNGLGPFLCRALERAGARIAAVAGRSPDRAAANAAEVGELLGHPVGAAADAAALCAAGIDALVVANPAEHHLAGLEAALAAGLPCLCEKPLVGPDQLADGQRLVAAFAARGLLLRENCQWPYVLPAVDALHGPGPQPARRLAMGLCPGSPGTAAMVQDSLPHLLSVAESLLPGGPGAASLRSVHVDVRSPAATRVRLELCLERGGAELWTELELEHRAEQPRPAWLEVDGRRIDRRIGSGYAISFTAGDRTLAVEDPLQQLVRSFLQQLRAAGPAGSAPPDSTVRAGTRLQLYADALRRLAV